VDAALATDVYAATYLFGALTNPQQNEALDTNSAYVSQSSSLCGQPTATVSSPLVTISGPFVNEVAYYYESVEESSPLYYNRDTNCVVRRDTGASLDCTTPTPTSDFFWVEAFTDAAGRTVFMSTGKDWGGTLAGYEYIANCVLKVSSSNCLLPSGSDYTASWYVIRWQDAASGVSANSIPDPGDTYTLIASGP
jgi:hypothetical protein